MKKDRFGFEKIRCKVQKYLHKNKLQIIILLLCAHFEAKIINLYIQSGHSIGNVYENINAVLINPIPDYSPVSVYEYVDKEEHDAKLLFSGMLLKEYHVNKDTGEIEEIQ